MKCDLQKELKSRSIEIRKEKVKYKNNSTSEDQSYQRIKFGVWSGKGE